MTTGYSLRNTPTMVERLNNRPKRRSWDEWAKDLSALSGKVDVSTHDLSFEEEQEAFAEAYALNECAEGRWREDHPNDPTET